MGSENYRRLSISLPENLFEKFENLRENLGVSRSDAIRKSMNLFILDQEKDRSDIEDKEVMAIISYVEKSHIHSHPPDSTHSHSNDEIHTINGEEGKHIHSNKHEQTQYYLPMEQIEFIKANEIQHEFLDIIQTSLHFHLGPESCLEIMACRGKYFRIKALNEKIQSLKTITLVEMNIMEIFD